MRKFVSTSLFAIAAAAILFGTAATTFATVCHWGTKPPRANPDFGGSYCLNAMQVNYHEVFNCPCRVRGSVSATGPFACEFYAVIEWGGPFAMSSSTFSAPSALVATYDIDLDCGQTFKVEFSCSCGERPRLAYFTDQGECMVECPEEDPPSTGG